MIREGGAADAARIAEMEHGVFSDAWGEGEILSHLRSPCARTLLLEEDGSFVGYLLGSVIPPEGEVLRVAVLPAYRGRGYAEALLSAFLSEVPVCFLEVRKGNTAARRLYEKVGFLCVGERKRYYKNPTEDACLYRLDT